MKSSTSYCNDLTWGFMTNLAYFEFGANWKLGVAVADSMRRVGLIVSALWPLSFPEFTFPKVKIKGSFTEILYLLSFQWSLQFNMNHG